MEVPFNGLEPSTYIFRQILIEREHQNQKWGGIEHDAAHFECDWIEFLEDHCGEAYLHIEDGSPVEVYRHNLIEIAALAVAAIEALDYKCELDPQFWESDEYGDS